MPRSRWWFEPGLALAGATLIFSGLAIGRSGPTPLHVTLRLVPGAAEPDVTWTARLPAPFLKVELDLGDGFRRNGAFDAERGLGGRYHILAPGGRLRAVRFRVPPDLGVRGGQVEVRYAGSPEPEPRPLLDLGEDRWGAEIRVDGPPLRWGEMPAPARIFRVLASVGLGLALALGATRGPRAIAGIWRHRRRDRELWGIAGIVVGGLGTWVAWTWPGILNYDSFALLKSIHAGDVIGEWFGAPYSLLVGTWHALSADVGWVAAAQAAIAAAVSVGALVAARRRGAPRGVVLACALALALAPINGAFTVQIGRDALFSWLLVALALTLPAGWVGRPPGETSRAGWIGAALLAFVVAWMRKDAAYVILLYPLARLAAGGWTSANRRAAARVFALSAVLYALALGALDRVPWYGTPSSYALTAVLNPLGAILSRPHFTRDAGRDRAEIGAVFNPDEVVREHTPDEIPLFHRGGHVQPLTPEAKRTLYGAYARLAWDNLDLWLANRVYVLAGIMGFSSRSAYIWDELRNPQANSFPEQAARLLGIPRPPGGEAAPLPFRVTLWSLDFQARRWLRLALGSLGPALLFSLAVLAYWRRLPICALALLIVVARVPVVFATAPAPFFKYLQSWYHLPFLLIPWVVVEWRSRATHL